MASLEDNEKKSSQVQQKGIRHVDNFFTCLNEMRKSSISTDVTLKSNTEIFPAHQVVLSAGSPFFKKMFESDFKESLTKTVDFSHIQDEILGTILEYLYLPSDDTVKNASLDWDQCLEVYKLSQMLELKELSEICWTFIKQDLSTENCLTILKTVVVYNEVENINALIKYTYMNLEDVVGTQSFQDLTVDEMKTLLSKFNKRNFLMKDYFLKAIVEWAKQKDVRLKSLPELIFYLCFDLISREFMDDLMQSENFLHEDRCLKSYIEFQLRPKLKSKSEINSENNKLDAPLNLLDELPSLRLFRFGTCTENVSGNNQDALQIITIKNNICSAELISIPFLMWEGISCVYNGSQFYVVGGELTDSDGVEQTTNSFLYDWKTNIITWKPSLKYEVRDSLVYVCDDRIYVVGGTESNSSVNIQYYVKSKQHWNSIWLEKTSEFKLLSCVIIKNELYLLCEKTDWHYCVYKIDENCTLHSDLPLYIEYAFEFKLLTEYNGLILIFFCKDFKWFCLTYNPEDKISQNISIDAPVSVKFLLCKNTKNNGILFYSEENGIYRFNYEKREIKRVTEVKLSESEEEKFHVNLGHPKMFALSDL